MFTNALIKFARSGNFSNSYRVWLITAAWLLSAAAGQCLTPNDLVADVIQANVSGNGTSAQLGSPFGQSFRPTSDQALSGIALALVNTESATDLTVSLFATDASGTLIGNALTSGVISSAEIIAFGEPGNFTPVWIPVLFQQPYQETPGERLAFVVNQNPMSFYYAAGTSYANGSLLGDPSKDLAFATLVVPEPSVTGLMGLAMGMGVVGGIFRKKRGGNDENRMN